MRFDKLDWLLLVLRWVPLDRVQLMKALFLVWRRSKIDMPGFYKFVPYLYGPFSPELYAALDEAIAQGLVIQDSERPRKWAAYQVTDAGRKRADAVRQRAPRAVTDATRTIAEEVGKLSFHELLDVVYSEAPEFTTRSLVRRDRGRARAG